MKTRIIYTLIILLLPALLFAQGVRNNGAQVVVTEDTKVVVAGDNGHLTNQNQGTINNDGTIQVAGNLHNESGSLFSSLNNLGEVVFSWFKKHFISGGAETYFENLTVSASDTLVIAVGETATVQNLCQIDGLVMLEGTLNIENQLVLNGQVEGQGTISYCGTQPQWVAAGTFSPKIEVRNLAGCSLTSATTITNELILTQGVLSLGDHDLSIGLQASITRANDINNFINASGAGYLDMAIAQTGLVLFPVGTNDSGYSYAPVSIDLTAGTFTNARLGIREVNQKHAKNQDVTNYLTRYWNFRPVGIENVAFDATFAYDPSLDVVGNEMQVSGAIKSSLEEFLWDTTGVVDMTDQVVTGTYAYHQFTQSNCEIFCDVTGVNICKSEAIVVADPVHCAGETIELFALDEQLECQGDCDMPTGYCASASMLYFEQFISEVKLGDSTHTSGNSNYSDFTVETFKALFVDSTYHLEVGINNWNTQNHFATAYFDWNRDGDFDDSGETWPMSSASGSTIYTENIQVPSNLALGKTRMRIIVRHDAEPQACGNYSIGETEDYMIDIRDIDPNYLTAFSWTGPNGWSSSNQTDAIENISVMNSGSYHLTVTDKYQCTNAASFDIVVHDPQIHFPHDTVYTMLPETLVYTPGIFDSYNWSTGGTDALLLVDDFGTFRLTVTENGCEDIDSVQVKEVQEIPLHTGWGIFSTYINTTANMSDLLAEVLPNVLLVKNDLGQVLTTIFGGLNGIGNHIVGESYQYKMISADILMVFGDAVDPANHELSLFTNYSNIAYLRRTEASVEAIMSPLGSNLRIVKDEMGKSYWPIFGINHIGNMVPGQGYQIRMYNADVLVYPANNVVLSKSGFQELDVVHFEKAEPTGANMTLGIPMSAWTFDVENGDEVAVYNAQDQLVGAGAYNNENLAIAIWGTDEMDNKKAGAQESSSFSIAFWDQSTGETSKLLVAEWLEGNEIYQDHKISVVGSLVQEGQKVELSLSSYPNPVKNYTDIAFRLPDAGYVELLLLDNQGRLLQNITAEHYEAGNHTLRFDCSHLANGMYHIQLKANKQQVVKPIQKI